jgi:hypothetical protein
MGKMTKVLLDGLGVGANVMSMPNQFYKNSRYVSRLPYEDVPIFLKEFDKREFLFSMQIVPYMSDLGGLNRAKWNFLTVFSLWLDGQLRSLGFGHDQVQGGGGTWSRLSSNLGVMRTQITCQSSRMYLDCSHKLALHPPFMKMTPIGSDIFRTK